MPITQDNTAWIEQMFWKLGFHNQKSPLEALLEKDDVRLEDVLDQEDIIQEAKAGNDRLIALYVFFF